MKGSAKECLVWNWETETIGVDLLAEVVEIGRCGIEQSHSLLLLSVFRHLYQKKK
jgi:hypothetical protein